MLDRNDIASFLFFGYLPQVPSNLESKAWALKAGTSTSLSAGDLTESDLTRGGVCILNSVFENVGNGQHIVPLSGGLDSRAILGGLINAGKKDHITAVTFGVPGTFDYDIGCYVAKQMGIRHGSLNLTQVRLEQALLEEEAKEMGTWAWLFDAFYNHLIAEQFGKESTYWSGFMGDPLAGSHLLPQDSLSWEEAISQFIGRNRFARSVDLTSPNFDPASVLPRSPLLEGSILGYDEQIDFAIRQESYIRHIVTASGYDYRLPFLNPDWVNFILNVPRHYRKAQYLYKEILKVAYPRLFSMPVKNNLGLSLNAPSWKRQLKRLNLNGRSILGRIFPHIGCSIHPGLNYIDFDRGLRERADLKAVVFENIQDLKKRRILDWIDIDAIWQRHQSSIANHADALTILGSLEISLKSQEKWP